MTGQPRAHLITVRRAHSVSTISFATSIPVSRALGVGSRGIERRSPSFGFLFPMGFNVGVRPFSFFTAFWLSRCYGDAVEAADGRLVPFEPQNRGPHLARL